MKTLNPRVLAARLAKAHAEVDREILKPLFTRLEKAQAEVSRIETMIDSITGAVASGGKSPNGRIKQPTNPRPINTGNGQQQRKSGKGKRIRRSPEELAKLASQILAFVRDGKGKTTGSEIAAKFPGLKLAPAAFVAKHGGGEKIKQSGDRGPNVSYSA